MTKFTVRALLILWPLASLVDSVIEIFTDRGNQWDLRNYLAGVKAFVEGHNPYVDAIFIYPPLFLPVLAKLTGPFTYDQLYVALLGLKLLGFFGLTYFWKRGFLRDVPWHFFVPLVWLGFYASFATDIFAGNISTFETFLLFTAFYFFLIERPYACALMIALGSAFKIAPLFFLVLLLARPRGLRPLLAGVGAFAAFLALNFFVYPTFTRSFFAEAWGRTAERRLSNPNALALFRDMIPLSARPLDLVLWLAFALSVYFVSWRAWRARGPAATRLETVLFLVLVYAITVPRMKDYAYMLVLPSVIFAIRNFRFRRWDWILALPLLTATMHTAPNLFVEPAKLLQNYYPFWVAAGFWGLYLWTFTVKPTRDRELPRAHPRTAAR